MNPYPPNLPPPGEVSPPATVTLEELQAQENALLLRELRIVDLESVRAMREIMAAAPDAPADIVELENKARTLRAKFKK